MMGGEEEAADRGKEALSTRKLVMVTCGLGSWEQTGRFSLLKMLKKHNIIKRKEPQTVGWKIHVEHWEKNSGPEG